MRIKRAFDVVIVLVAAVIWLPAVIAGALLILLTAGRPVFYRSTRLVDNSSRTTIVKFRTMIKNADKLVNRDTVPVTTTRFLNIAPDSPLYTRAGRFLERVGLTEVPQFVHVLSGKMSIVGNRPLPANVMDALLKEYPYASDRFLTPAGLTGPAQLVGRDLLSDSERLRIEGAYCRAALHGNSVRLDLTLLIYTVLIVARLKRPLPYQEVMDLIDRRSNQLAFRVDTALEELPSSDVA